MSPNVYLSRWHMCLELFGRVFLDDVGLEPHSVLNELGRFDVKEAKFKREMEKLKNGHQKDLYLEGVCFLKNFHIKITSDLFLMLDKITL